MSCSLLGIFGGKKTLPSLIIPDPFSWEQPRGICQRPEFPCRAVTPRGLMERWAGTGAQVRTETELQEGMSSLKEWWQETENFDHSLLSWLGRDLCLFEEFDSAVLLDINVRFLLGGVIKFVVANWFETVCIVSEQK